MCPLSDHEFVLCSIKMIPIRMGVNTIETRSITDDKLDIINIRLQESPFYFKFESANDNF